MIEVTREFTVPRPIDTVVGYLRDFARTEQWDPGTKTCVQETPGPIVVGTKWHNVSEFKGRETELTYTLQTADPDHLVFAGEGKHVTTADDLSFASVEPGQTRITYHATIDFHGLFALASPFLHSEFEDLGDKTQEQLTRVLTAL